MKTLKRKHLFEKFRFNYDNVKADTQEFDDMHKVKPEVEFKSKSKH